MFILTKSNLFCIIVSRKKGFVFGTFGRHTVKWNFITVLSWGGGQSAEHPEESYKRRNLRRALPPAAKAKVKLKPRPHQRAACRLSHPPPTFPTFLSVNYPTQPAAVGRVYEYVMAHLAAKGGRTGPPKWFSNMWLCLVPFRNILGYGLLSLAAGHSRLQL